MENRFINKVTGMVKGILPFYFFSFLPLNISAGNLANYEVVPLPQCIAMQKGEPLVLNNHVQILAGEGLQREALFLQQYLKEVSDLDLAIAGKQQKKTTYITLSISPKVKEAEGYVLTVNQKGVTIQGGSAAGVFYGIQALPRMSALSEVQWTQPERKDYEAFKERLTRLTALFELYRYQYAKHLPSRWQF